MICSFFHRQFFITSKFFLPSAFLFGRREETQKLSGNAKKLALTIKIQYVTIWLLSNFRSLVFAQKGLEIMASDKKIDLEYKGHPLRRKDNMIYFGSMAEKYIILLQILDTKKIKDLDVATKVSVQLQLTDPEIKSRDRVVKKSEKDSLYAAMDVASVWLERALAQ